MKKLKKQTIKDIKVGNILGVFVAYSYKKDLGWYAHILHRYIVTEVSPKVIIGLRENDVHEGIKIYRDDLDSGRFII